MSYHNRKIMSLVTCKHLTRSNGLSVLKSTSVSMEFATTSHCKNFLRPTLRWNCLSRTIKCSLLLCLSLHGASDQHDKFFSTLNARVELPLIPVVGVALYHEGFIFWMDNLSIEFTNFRKICAPNFDGSPSLLNLFFFVGGSYLVIPKTEHTC